MRTEETGQRRAAASGPTVLWCSSGLLSRLPLYPCPMLALVWIILLILASGVSTQGRLKLTVLSEDRLQMKWKEAEGPVQGYKVRVRPISEVPQPELMLTTTRGRATVAGLDSTQEYLLQVLVLNGTVEKLIAKRRFTIDVLREEEEARNGNQKHKRKVQAVGSGSGEMDDATEVLESLPTVLYQDPTTKETPTITEQEEQEVEKGKDKKKKKKDKNRPKIKDEKVESRSKPAEEEHKVRKNTPVTAGSSHKPFECRAGVQADLVLLVDGSWSIGRTNFKKVREFLEGLVTPFHIGPYGVQFALSQYSGDPRTEWQLNNFTAKEQLLDAVRNFRYKGGNTFTGQALIHVLEENLKEEVGARSDTPQFLLLLTDGKSQDDAVAAASRLKNAGVEIIAVGVKNADEAELKQIASEPLDLNVYNVNDFPLLSKLVGRLVRILCGKMEERSKTRRAQPTEDPGLSYPSPTDLQYSELGPKEVRLSWTNPGRAVHQYRVVFHSSEGQSPQEVVVKGLNSTVMLTGLASQTQYHVSIFPVYEDNVGSPLRGIFTTTMLAMPESLEVTASSPSSLRVRWRPAHGATQYMALYSALTDGEPDDAREVKFRADETDVELRDLMPSTDYSVTVYALYEDEPSDPATAVATTFQLPSPLTLQFPMVSHSALKVTWVPGAVDVPAHRVTYSTNHGSDVKQVEVADVNTVLLQNLSSLSKYLVSVQSLYAKGLSTPLTGNITTLRVPAPSELQVTNYSENALTVHWEPAADDVTSYLIKWISLSGGDLRQLKVNGQSEGAMLEDVEDDKEYQISLSALYADGAQSEAVAIRYSTLYGGGPSSVSISEETPVSMLVSWLPPNAHVLQYHVSYTPLTPGDARENKVLLPGSERRVLLQSLLPDTRYSVLVTAEYRNKEGGSASAQGKTTSLRVSSVSVVRSDHSSICVSWRPVAAVTAYRIVIYGLKDKQKKEETVQSTSNSHCFYELQPETVYRISVHSRLGTVESTPVTILHPTAVAPLRAQVPPRLHPIQKEMCPEMTIRNSVVKGFNMMEAFGLTQRAHSTVEGVSVEPFIFSTLPSYTLYRDVQLTQSTGFIHPSGFSPEHTISMAFRLLQDSPKEPFALWQLTDNDFQPKMGVVLDPERKVLLYFSLDYRGEVQELTFDQPQVHTLFYGSFHKVHLSISQVSVSLSVDCRRVGERPARPLGNIPTDGFEMLGKLVRSRGPRSGSAAFQLQSFEIICNITWALEDTCCDLPSQRDEESCPALPYACTCTSDIPGAPGEMGSPGKPGPRGQKGEKGEGGQKGEMGPPGKAGPEGGLGPVGSLGPRGITVMGKIGPPGIRGEKGEMGIPGKIGLPGPPGPIGEMGNPGPKGTRGVEGNMGPTGTTGPRGLQGIPGHPGPAGERGPLGPVGPSGLPGIKGERGEKGEPQSLAIIYDLVTQACEKLVHDEVHKLDEFLNEIRRNPVPVEEPVGPPGEPGIPGGKGRPGLRGPPGRQGNRGETGRPGYPGEQGRTGLAGMKGDPGSTVHGPPGKMGFPGPPGESKMGNPGPRGVDGKSGIPGISGAAGQPGELGPPGLCDSSSGCHRGGHPPADPYYGYQP